MMDGSLLENGKTPSNYEYNRDVTKRVVNYAHARGVSVEGEIGNLGGVEDGHGIEIKKGEKVDHSQFVSKPDDVERLWKETGMDACAIAYGTSHGAYKFKPGSKIVLRHDVVEEIHKKVPELYLVSHGSSSVPQDLVDGLNSYTVVKKYERDGEKILSFNNKEFSLNRGNVGENLENALYEVQRMPGSMGVPMEQLQESIKKGMRKINVDTDGRMYITQTILDVMYSNPKIFDPRGYLKPAMQAVTDFVKVGMGGFGSAGMANTVDQTMTLKETAKMYRNPRR